MDNIVISVQEAALLQNIINIGIAVARDIFC